MSDGSVVIFHDILSDCHVHVCLKIGDSPLIAAAELVDLKSPSIEISIRMNDNIAMRLRGHTYIFLWRLTPRLA